MRDGSRSSGHRRTGSADRPGSGRRGRRATRGAATLRPPAGAGLPAAAALALAALAAAAPVRAQDAALVDACAAAAPSSDALRFCDLIVQAIEEVQPRVALAGTGGNPVPGTASTLGMRLGDVPRVSGALRVTGVWADAPQALLMDGTGDLDFRITSYNADAAVGLFQGFSPAATVGGVGSVDLLASVGLVSLPGDEGFRDDTPFTWAAGVRLGVLRESFTLPGVSITGMYRQVGDVGLGDPTLAATDGFFALDGIGVWSLRGAVSKQLFALGATVGAGYDHFSSDVELGLADAATGVPLVRLSAGGFENDRFMAFANISYTLLIVHFVAELGWQAGGDVVAAPLPPTADVDTDGALFGGLALRVSI